MDGITMEELLNLEKKSEEQKLPVNVKKTKKIKSKKISTTEAPSSSTPSSSAPLEVSMVRRPMPLNAKKMESREPKKVMRDPRFDDLSGDLNMEKFKKNYWYVHELRENEKKELIKASRKIKSKEKLKNVKETLLRINNQEKALTKKSEMESFQRKQKYQALKRLHDGQKPQFSKSKEQLKNFKDSRKQKINVYQQEKRNAFGDKKKFPVLK